MDERFRKFDATAAPIDATVTVSVTSDGMKAEVLATAPQNGGANITVEMLRAALAQKNVVFGINETVLTGFANKPMYSIPIGVAQGVPPAHGKPASIKQLIQTDNDLRPKELPDGTVDYKDLGIIHSVKKGDLLCEKIPPTPGIPGTNVYGGPIAAKPGRDIPLPAGKNTVISEDKLSLYAGCDGQADIVNRKIQILNTFFVDGDVCNATGNISFLGNVQISGSVLTGFMVQATGNISVGGSVEGAQIVAGGNIVLKGGINGSGKGMVKAGGYVKTKYIQSGAIQAAGDIEASFCLHSTAQSGGSVTMLGSKSTIIGGHIVAMKSITTNAAGSRNSYVPTTLEVGTDPNALARSRELPQEMEANKRESSSLLRVINLMGEHKKAGRLTPDKLDTLQKAINTYQALGQTLMELEDEYAIIQDNLASSGKGTVNIQGTAYPGVKIVIGSETMPLESNYDHCTFSRPEGSTIHFGPLR